MKIFTGSRSSEDTRRIRVETVRYKRGFKQTLEHSRTPRDERFTAFVRAITKQKRLNDQK